MAVIFDPDKDAANVRKHGVSLARAGEMDIEEAVVVVDDRRDYGEARFNAYGLIDGRLFALTFTSRGQDIRAISLRRAREKEVRIWLGR